MKTTGEKRWAGLLLNRVRTGPGNPEKPWKIFEALEIPGNPWKSP